jgi:prephenate dehydrogenase
VKVGLVGYGRFGTLAARVLSRYLDVLIYDIRPAPGARVRHRRITRAPLERVAAQRIVILAVPISGLQECLRTIAGMVHPGALVMDVCSVKSHPMRWMKRILPEGAYYLGTHPLFGPDSVSRSLRGHRIVLCPGRIPGALLLKITRLLRREGLEVYLMHPRSHDRMIAETLLLTQYIGRLVHHAGLGKRTHSTAHYERLRELCRVAERDSIELFRDMWNFNPYARNLEMRLTRARRQLTKELQGRKV